VLLHKHAGDAVDGILVTPVSGRFNQDKTFSNTDDDGIILTDNGNTIKESNLATNMENAVSILECWRPLIYEPIAMLEALCGNTTTNQGARSNRQVASCLVSGSFRIRMIEGINDPLTWSNHVKMVEHSGMPDGEDNYGRDGFSANQFVRAICIRVHDMGGGYGLGRTNRNDSIQAAPNTNFRNDDAAGVGAGLSFTGNSNLLAPALGDIFDNVGRDPDCDYTHVTDGTKDYNNEDMIKWTYKKKRAVGATPEWEQTVDSANAGFVDPLRGSFRKRKFHVVYDKKIMFVPGGSQDANVDNKGHKQYDFRWSVKLKNIICQQDATNTFDNQSRVAEQMSVRLFWYFIPSISAFRNGNSSNTADSGSGHHGFTVARGPEKCFWTEKDDQ